MSKQQQIEELFKSHQLVKYPSDDEQMSMFLMVNKNDLILIQELDESPIVEKSQEQKESGIVDAKNGGVSGSGANEGISGLAADPKGVKSSNPYL